MKKRVLFATVVALACTSLTSCLKSDDWEMFNHPINVTGEMHPTFGFPVGSGEMNMNDLLTSLSANYNGNISDTGDLITVEYTVTTSDTVFASDYMPSSKGVKHPASKRQGAKYKNGAKADAYTKDTVLETTIDIDFFDDVELLDSIFITHVWADLAVGFHGYFGDNPNIVQNLHVSFDSVEIWYDTPNSPTSVQFNDPNLSAFHVDINDLTVDSLYAFPRMDMASMVNDRPSKLYARYHLKIRVDPGIIAQNISTMSIQEILDELSIGWISYSANMDLNMPLTMLITNMNYDFNVDLGEGLSGVNLDSILKNINEGLGAEITLSEFTLDLSNGIPLNLNLSAIAYSEMNVPLCTLFSNELVPAAELVATNPNANPVVYEAGTPSHHTITAALNKADLENLKNAKTLKVFMIANSSNKHVAVKRSDMLKMKAYLKVHPTVTVDIEL